MPGTPAKKAVKKAAPRKSMAQSSGPVVVELLCDKVTPGTFRFQDNETDGLPVTSIYVKKSGIAEATVGQTKVRVTVEVIGG